jgi:hypothetical protein
MTEEKTKPILKVKVGACEGAVWKNTKDDKTFYNVTTSRNYKDGEEWKTTNSLNANNVPDMIIVLQKCYEFIKMTAGKEEKSQEKK